MSASDIQMYITTIGATLIGAIVGFIGNFLLERRKEFQRKRETLKEIECMELINSVISFDENLLGGIADFVPAKAPKKDVSSKSVDVRDVYFARYRFRNMSASPIENLLIALQNAPKLVWHYLSHGEASESPEWSRQFTSLNRKEKDSTIVTYSIPYLNPFAETHHEIFLDVASDSSLNNLKIVSGGKGIIFTSQKLESYEKEKKKRSISVIILIFEILAIIALLAVLINGFLILRQLNSQIP